MLLVRASALALTLLFFASAPAREPLELWLYHATNLWVDENIDRLEALWRRAAKAGYGKVLLADSKFAKLGDMDERYFNNHMFDPHHNARKDYYLVRGDLARSWEGLPRDVVIVNWNFERRDESLSFFAERGHRQVIAGYYDGPVEQVREWLASAARVNGVVGIMYTTWRGGYDDLEAFAAACRG